MIKLNLTKEQMESFNPPHIDFRRDLIVQDWLALYAELARLNEELRLANMRLRGVLGIIARIRFY